MPKRDPSIPRYELRPLSEHTGLDHPYKVIADLMREDIATGTFGGFLVPSILEGAGFYGVARNTYFAAIKLLRAEGLVATVSTLGTFILPPQS
jgi:DNA-binding transcriptional regulator YhcF (GntR family)